jgi:hypothetical protein
MRFDLPDRITPAEKQSWQDVCRQIDQRNNLLENFV